MNSCDKEINVIAQWDTGASITCISHESANSLKLKSVGKANINTPSGSKEVDAFLLDVKLPGRITIKDLRVIDSEIGQQGIGLLIGMDIIGLGDFAVSNYNGKTKFTFRAPSVGHVDFNQPVFIGECGNIEEVSVK